MGVGKVRVWRKNSKIDNDDWMIILNRPRPFIFIGWEDLPCKQCFTTRNQAKLLILPEIGKTRLDRPWGAVRPPGTFVPDWLQCTRSDRPGTRSNRPA